jgi:Sulfotransferase domain
MTLQVVGAGLPRTGTTSLKLAVERLAGGHCYHMADVFAYPEHIRVWHDAIGGHPPDSDKFLANYRNAAGGSMSRPITAGWR